MDHHSECYGSDSQLRVRPVVIARNSCRLQVHRTSDEFGQNGFWLPLAGRGFFFLFLFCFVLYKREAWQLNCNWSSVEHSSFCDLCVRLIRLFAYRFGVFRLAEHAGCLVWFGLVWFFGFFVFALAATGCAVFLLAKSICIQQRIHLASFYLQHKQLHNCYAAIEFEFIGQAFSLRGLELQSKQLTKRKSIAHKFSFATI